jgi:hypothetical protein
MHIVDVVIIKLNNFGSVGNIGHINGNNIGGAKVTIQLKTTKKVDQFYRRTTHSCTVKCPKKPELHGQQHSQHLS